MGGLCPGLAWLSLRDNGVGDRGAIALAGALRGCPRERLVFVSLSENAVGELGAAALAGALERGACPFLAKLHLDNQQRSAYISGEDVEIVPISGLTTYRIKPVHVSGSKAGMDVF